MLLITVGAAIRLLCRSPVGVVNARHIINTIYILSCSCTRAFTSHNFCVCMFLFCSVSVFFFFVGYLNKWHRLRCNGNDCVIFCSFIHIVTSRWSARMLNTHIQSIFESPNVLNNFFFFLRISNNYSIIITIYLKDTQRRCCRSEANAY